MFENWRTILPLLVATAMIGSEAVASPPDGCLTEQGRISLGDVSALDYATIKLNLAATVDETNAHVDVDANLDIAVLDYATIKLNLDHIASCTP